MMLVRNFLMLVIGTGIFFIISGGTPDNNKTGVPEKGDTVVTPVTQSIFSRPDPYSHLRTLSDLELTRMIDSLLDLDQIPVELVVEIKLLAGERVRPVTATVVSPANKTYPASHIYPAWDNFNLFPYKDTLSRSDSTLMLVLASKETGSQFVQPRQGVITSNFGWREGASHNGIDIDLVAGDKVVAAFDGKVRVARKEWPYGKFIIIRHYNGLETVYAHLSKFRVKSGEEVKAGQVIAHGGNTGRSTGSHLHFEMRYKGVPMNPRYLISFEEGKLISDTVILKKNRYGFAVFPKGSVFHTVKKGDTLFEIAKRYGSTTGILRRMNGLPAKAILRVGQQIRIG